MQNSTDYNLTSCSTSRHRDSIQSLQITDRLAGKRWTYLTDQKSVSSQKLVTVLTEVEPERKPFGTNFYHKHRRKSSVMEGKFLKGYFKY